MAELSFNAYGSGHTILLVHGFCESKDIWMGFAEALAEDFSVLCVDLPGCGESMPMRSGFSIADVAAALHESLMTRVKAPVVVVGHSMGGYVSLAMAERFPGSMAGLVLFHSTARPDSDDKKINRDRVIRFIRKQGVPAFVRSFVPTLFADPSAEGVQDAVRVGIQASIDTLVNYTAAMRDRPGRLSILKALQDRMMIIGGEYDPVVTPESIEEQTRPYPGIERHILPGIAHMGMLESRPESLGIIRAFAIKCFGKKAQK